MVVSLALSAGLAWAQAPEYPACVAAPGAARSIEQVQRLLDLRIDDGMEMRRQQLGALREALRARPDDFHLQRQLLRTLAGRFLGAQQQQAIEAVAERLRERPADPALRVLQAQSLVGKNSGEAMRLLAQLTKEHPRFAWPHLSLAELRSFPAWQDQPAMQAHLLAFFERCPDSLEPYDLLVRTSGPALAAPTAQLRRLLTGRTEAMAIRAWPRLWNLEFAVRPPSEHEALRQQIREDLARLRPLAENDLFLLHAVRHGARLTGDAELAQAMDTREAALLPLGAQVRRRYDEWQRRNPYPPAESERAAYRRRKVALLDELLRDDPQQVWFLHERLSLLADDAETPVAVLAAAGQRMLEAADPREEFWGATPPALLVARAWARRGVNRERIAGLVETGLAHQKRIERNDQGSDLLDAKLMATEVKDGALRNRIGTFDIAAEVWIRLGEFAQARQALLVVADAVSTYRDDLAASRKLPVDRTDRYRMALETLWAQAEHGFWLRQAQLAKSEGRKQDALACYGTALRAASGLSNQFLFNKLLPEAAALWKELGGTAEGWQVWRDATSLPAPTAVGPTAAAPEWTQVDRPFPAFRLRDRDGRERTLDDLKGTVTLVNVWATWCEPCRAELPLLQRLHDRLRESGGARVITLNTDLSTGLVTPFLTERKYTFPVWMGQALFDQLKPMGGIPLHWIIDREGVIRWESSGFSRGKDDEWVEAMAAKVLSLR
jgi:thiol-disulfide isomerase/thioredoxin